MKDVSILLCDYPMPLAETASIFNELLLAERMLTSASPEAEIALLEQQISRCGAGDCGHHEPLSIRI